MKYTIYQITNLIDGKIYIGCHKTDNLDDGYMGSGTYLRRAINKHGIENFQKDILGVFDTPEEMFQMESVLVNEEFVDNKDTYNLKLGGEGGFDYINSNCGNQGERLNKNLSHEKRLEGARNSRIKERLADLRKDPDFKKKETERLRVAFKGKSHTEDAKTKIGEANSKHQKGSGNSQYGTCWIYHPELKENKKIDKTLLDEYTQQGWIKGRKIKN